MKDITYIPDSDLLRSDMSDCIDEDGDAAMRLRPHHLFCTQGYEGRGYSASFAGNMTRYVSLMRTDPNFKVRLTAVPDDLCVACPNRIDERRCEDDCKVLVFDRNVMETFGLEYDRTYRYQDLIRQVDDGMTPEKMRSICGSCSWYESSACERNAVCGTHVMK